MLAALLFVTSLASVPPTFPYERIEQKLDNGVRLIIVPTADTGFFAIAEIVGTGSRDEVEAGHSGFAHFFEHMMFRGTEAFPADKRVALLASLGVDEGGYTTDDFTCYQLTGPVPGLAQVIALEGDRFQHLSYSEEGFKTESRAVLGEYNKNFANPDEKAGEVLVDLAFDRHTYKHTTVGYLKDIQKMPEEYKYSREFFGRFYTPDNLVIVVAGSVDVAAVQAAVQAAFGGWRGKRVKTDLADEPPLAAERRKQIGWDNPVQDRLHVGWRVPSGVDDPKNAALGLLLRSYTFSDSSDLWNGVVLDEGLAESVESWWTPHKDASLFGVYARIKDGKNPDDVLVRIQRELDDVAAGKINDRRFSDVKSNLRYSLLLRLTSPSAIADRLAEFIGPALGTGGAASYVDGVYGALAELGPKDLQQYVKELFGKDRRAVVVLHHEPSAKRGAP